MRISKILIIPIFCFVCLIGVGALTLFLMATQGVFYDARLLAEKNRELEDLKSQEQHIREFQEQRPSLFATLQLIEGLFGDANNPIGFLEFLEALAGSLGLTIDVIPNAPQKIAQDPWTSMTFAIHLKGPYSSTMRFLEMLDNAPYLVEVREVSIAAGSVHTGSDADFSFSVKLYTK